MRMYKEDKHLGFFNKMTTEDSPTKNNPLLFTNTGKSPNKEDLRPTQTRDPGWKGESTNPQNVLRHRLDQLEYFEPFTPESAALIQNLLSDLIQTTETAKKFKNKLDLLIQERNLAQEQVGFIY